MTQNRSKTYRANYRGNDVWVHIKRLAVFGLSLVVIRGGYELATITTGENEIPTDRPGVSSNTEDENKALIEKIIKENPNILFDITMDTYEVKFGDTLSGIAEECGNTIRRICALNDMDSKDIIRPGDELKVEIIKEKSELDKKIAALESYLHNYVFSSPIAEMARTESEDLTTGAMYYRSIIYGNPKDAATIDPNSFYGMFVTSYLRFHEKTEATDETKKEYIAVLSDIAKELEEKLNLGGAASNIIPYDTYFIYLQNRSTEYDEVIETYRSIYN